MNLSSAKIWWEQLNSREQRLVQVMGTAIAIFLLYSVVWQPLNTKLIAAEKTLSNRQTLLTWVDENTARYQNIRSNNQGKKTTGSLSSIVNRSATQHQLTISRMQPQGNNLQVWLDSTPFTQLLYWLEHLANDEGLQVQAIDLAKGDKPGEVRVRRLQLIKQ
ncbi:MAG: type II secretion system protein M [Litorilituus sp.]|jgi:general secretion pathway protein M|nr:type II secretion system protein M [Litorilituus sp.]